MDKIDKISLITKRDIERQLNLQKQKEDRDLKSSDTETFTYFDQVFMKQCSSIEEAIDNSNSIEKPNLPDHFNTISKDILTLQKYVATSNIFLRNYDLQKCQTALQELTLKSKNLEEKLIPKKKFGFKNKPKFQSNTEIIAKNDQVDSNPKIIISKDAGCDYSNKKKQVLSFDRDKVFKKDVTLENIDNCKVFLKGSPSTLHLNSLKDSTVLTGPISTSIFASNCENCTFVIACQQLRLHTSKNIDIYLQVTSRAIMEDCNEIQIAPYNWEYAGIEDDFESAGLDKNINNWKSIDDFNWLNVEKQSPHWKIKDNIVKKWEDCD